MNQTRGGFSVRLRLLYGALSTLLALAGVEAIVRAFELAPPIDFQFADNVGDPYLPFKRRPSSTNRGRSASDEFDFEYRHNALGFRDRDHETAKPDGVVPRGVLPNDVLDTAVGVDALVVSESGFLYSKHGEAAGPIGESLFLHSHAARIVLTRAFAWLASSDTILRPDIAGPAP